MELASELEFEESQARLFGLLEVARYMSYEKDIDKLLLYIANQVRSSMNCDRCSIFLIDEAHQEFWSKVHIGVEREIRFPLGHGIAGLTVKTKKPLIINDPYSHPYFNREIDKQTGYVTKSIMCVPLINFHNKVIGCFQAINAGRGDFNEDDQDYLIAFAAQAASAIESAILLREREQQIKMMDVIGAIERLLGSVQSEAELLELAFSHLMDSQENETCIVDVGHFRKVISRKPHSPSLMDGLRANKAEGRSILESYNKPELVFKAGAHPELFQWLGRELKEELGDIMVIPLSIDQPGQRADHGHVVLLQSPTEAHSYQNLFFATAIVGRIAQVVYQYRLQKQFVTQERLANIGQLTSTIVHDIRNPLTVVLGYAEMLEEDTPDKDATAQFGKVIARQTNRIINMIQEILAFTRGEQVFNNEVVNVKDVLEEVAQLVQLDADKAGVTFLCEGVTDAFIEVDAEKLKRVIFNLTNNALEVLQKGQSLKLTCLKTPSSIELRVIDSGPGIPDSIKATLFDAFVTHGKSGGTGLGLHIAKEIMVKMQGSLEVEERGEPGTCFVMTLPLHKKPVAVS